MDDDGLPAARLPDQRCSSTTTTSGARSWSTRPTPDSLVFPVRPPGSATALRTVTQVRTKARDGVLPDIVIPFNGVLVTRELVDRIGLPREEFFIWGDDVEYLWRAREAGARVATVTDARRRATPASASSARRWRSVGRRTTTARATSSTSAWPATTSSTCATTAARCTRWPSW